MVRSDSSNSLRNFTDTRPASARVVRLKSYRIHHGMHEISALNLIFYRISIHEIHVCPLILISIRSVVFDFHRHCLLSAPRSIWYPSDFCLIFIWFLPEVMNDRFDCNYSWLVNFIVTHPWLVGFRASVCSDDAEKNMDLIITKIRDKVRRAVKLESSNRGTEYTDNWPCPFGRPRTSTHCRMNQK